MTEEDGVAIDEEHNRSSHAKKPPKVPSLKEVNFGKVKLWAVEHFWTDFDLTKRRDNKMDQIF